MYMRRNFPGIENMFLFTAGCSKTMGKGIAYDNPAAYVWKVEGGASITVPKICPDHFEEVRIFTARNSAAITHEMAIRNH
jgi:hypothetical protein